jgi:hypothetical protein
MVGVSATDARTGSETRNVDDFVAMKASDFNTFQQALPPGAQTILFKASKTHTFSIHFNKA